MSDLPSLAKKIQIEETDFRSPVSESTIQKVGSSINFILDSYMIYPGQLVHFAGPEANVPFGYVVCDGRELSRTTYSGLFAAIGTYWGIGNGVSTFNVPDLRGRFMRMQSTTTIGASGRDPEESSRIPSGTGIAAEVGSTQSDAFQQHSHSIATNNGTPGSGYLGVGDGGNTAPQTGNAGGSAETRPKNAYTLILIKT